MLRSALLLLRRECNRWSAARLIHCSARLITQLTRESRGAEAPCGDATLFGGRCSITVMT